MKRLITLFLLLPLLCGCGATIRAGTMTTHTHNPYKYDNETTYMNNLEGYTQSGVIITLKKGS